MTTYRGDEIPKPDRLDEDLKLVGQKLGGMENVEEELNLPPSAEPDYLPKPGQKHYMETQPMADDDLGWTIDKMRGIMADPKNIRSMQPGDSWVSPKSPGDPKFINDAEKVRPRGISLHEEGGMVQKFGSSTHVNCKTKHGG
jgi:hypothetical protein